MSRTLPRRRKISARRLGECALSILLLLLMIGSFSPITWGYQTSQAPFPDVKLSVDFTSPVGISNLTLGANLEDWMMFPSKIQLKQEAKRVGFGLLRIFTSEFEPATQWNETTHTGTFNWSNFDKILVAIEASGAEPLVCINSYHPRGHPNGMYVDPTTKLPSVESAVEYAGALARHVKEKGYNVRYWEILNEAHYYVFTTINPNPTALNSVVVLFNQVAARIHSILPDALCGINSSNMKAFLEYFSQHGQGVGFLSFHKYDSGDPPYWAWYSNDEILRRASSGTQWPKEEYTPSEMANVWRSARGEELPVICSETNLNWTYANGTDPRIQQTIGAVWYAEELRSFVLMGVRHSIYFDLASSKSWGQQHTSSMGWGFGMMDCDTYEEWYPFIVNYLVSVNLKPGNSLFAIATSDENKVSALAWKNQQGYQVLLIGKVDGALTLSVDGFPKGNATIQRIDSSSVGLQNENFKSGGNVRMTGYSIALISLAYAKALSEVEVISRTTSGVLFSDLRISVDGKDYRTPVSMDLTGVHKFTVHTIPVVDGKICSFARWEDESGVVLSTNASFAFDTSSGNKTLIVVFTRP